MTTAQQRPKQAHRMSTGGKDILSRMLLLERQSKDKRTPSTSPTSHAEPPFEHFNHGHTSSPRHQITPQLSPIPQSQNLASLLEAKHSAKPALGVEPLKIDTTKAQNDVPLEDICLSPSWSDHGEKKRRKEKKQRDREQREAHKRAKEQHDKEKQHQWKTRQGEGREGQRFSDIKGGRRLSKKPPPAAMETQKMSSGLREPRRNSLVSLFSSRASSREGSRRNSLSGDDRRPSRTSLSSQSGQTNSTPATSTERADSTGPFRSTVSPTAPRLPSFGWKSRKGSIDAMSKSALWGSEDAYDKEVVEFAYRLDASAFITESEKIEKKRSQIHQAPRASHFKEHTEVNGYSRSATEPNLAPRRNIITPPRSPKRPPHHQPADSERKATKSKGFQTATQDHETTVNSRSNRCEQLGANVPNGASSTRQPINPDLSSPERPSLQLKSSHDGSSYVHKQRMYQQQMSIAGFEDQQAVQAANELATQSDSRDGRQNHAFTLPVELPTATSVEQAATIRIPEVGRRESQETVASRSSRARPRRDSSPCSPSPATKHPSKPTPLSQSSKTVEMLDNSTLDPDERHSMHAQDIVVLNKTQESSGSMSDKILGFRRRQKPPPSKIWISENERTFTGPTNLMTAPKSAPVEPAAKRSRIEKMLMDPLSAQIPFRKRTDSAGSATLPAAPKEEKKEGLRSPFHTRNRTTSSEALTADLPSPMPRSNLIDMPRSTPRKTGEQLSPALKQKNSSQLEQKSSSEAKTDTPRNQSSGSILVTTTKDDKEPPDTPKAPAKVVSKQQISKMKEQNSAQEAELTRHAEMETVKSRAVGSNTSPVIGSNSQTTSGLISKHPTQPNSQTTALAQLPKAEREVVVESTTSEGLVRKTSITRPRSNPQLQTQIAATNSLPSLDFLPQLKHQPLVKSTRYSPPRAASDSIITQFPAPLSPLGSLSSSPANSRLLASTAVDLPVVLPRSPFRPPATIATSSGTLKQPPLSIPPVFNRSATSIPSASSTSLAKDTDMAGVNKKPVAKLFVICCKCKFWHDLPSKLYEAMALPRELHKVKHEGKAEKEKDAKDAKGKSAGEKGKNVAQLDTAVECPWCEHAMTTWCCQGWTAVVYLHQRHH